MYIRHDGNGGINISKSLGLLVTILIFLLGAIASMAYSYGTLSGKVNDILETNKEAGVRHTQIINDINSEQTTQNTKIAQEEKEIAILNTKLDTVITTLDKIDKKLE